MFIREMLYLQNMSDRIDTKGQLFSYDWLLPNSVKHSLNTQNNSVHQIKYSAKLAVSAAKL